MYRIISCFLVLAVLTGCAGGKFVSTGSVNYEKLFDALSCEINVAWRKYAESETTNETQLVIPNNWRAVIDVVIDGNVSRDATVGASINNYGIGGGDTIGGTASISRNVTDKGVVTLYREIEYGSSPDYCAEKSGAQYDVSALGFESWFMSIDKRMAGKNSNDLLRKLEYTRTALINFGPNRVSLTLLPTIKIMPSFGFSINEEIKIIIRFEKKPVFENATVKIDNESLRILAKLIQGEKITLSSPTSGRSSRDSEAAARRRELERSLENLSDDTQELLRRQTPFN